MPRPLALAAPGAPLSLPAAAGRNPTFAYDSLGNLTSITDALAGVTSFTYDPNGNLLSVTDPKNTANPTTHTYDSMDRLATRKDPLGNAESYTYDKNGNLTQFTDRRGKVTTYTYDALNRRTFAGFGTTQPGPTYESTISYSGVYPEPAPAGRRDANGSMRYGACKAGRPLPPLVTW